MARPNSSPARGGTAPRENRSRCPGTLLHGLRLALRRDFPPTTRQRAIVVNPTVGRLELTIEKSFPIAAYVTTMERFGYVLGPPSKDGGTQDADLVLRMGVCIAIAMNSMIFGISIYAGSTTPACCRCSDGSTSAYVREHRRARLGFFRSAWRGLLSRHLHIEFPIAVGILLSFACSAYCQAFGTSRGSYFDTLNIFIALMLVGRFLKARVIRKNRLQLQGSTAIDDFRPSALSTKTWRPCGFATFARATYFSLGRTISFPPGLVSTTRWLTFPSTGSPAKARRAPRYRVTYCPLAPASLGAPYGSRPSKATRSSALVQLLPGPTADVDEARRDRVRATGLPAAPLPFGRGLRNTTSPPCSWSAFGSCLWNVRREVSRAIREVSHRHPDRHLPLRLRYCYPARVRACLRFAPMLGVSFTPQFGTEPPPCVAWCLTRRAH